MTRLMEAPRIAHWNIKAPRSHRAGTATALLAGAAAATVVTLIHESVRHATPQAPRMDILGERAIAAAYRGIGKTPPPRRKLHYAALAADLVSNSLYYALVAIGSPKYLFTRGVVLGTAAGAGAVALPPVLGLGKAPRGITPTTKAMTFSYYLVGGMVAACVASLLTRCR